MYDSIGLSIQYTVTLTYVIYYEGKVLNTMHKNVSSKLNHRNANADKSFKFFQVKLLNDTC